MPFKTEFLPDKILIADIPILTILSGTFAWQSYQPLLLSEQDLGKQLFGEQASCCIGTESTGMDFPDLKNEKRNAQNQKGPPMKGNN